MDVSSSAATYTSSSADTAHTNASAIAWPMGRSRATATSCSRRVHPAIMEWLRAMKAWKGVE